METEIMFVRITTFDVNPNYTSNAKAFAEIFKLRLESYSGFISIEYFYNSETGVAKSITKWESKEQANAALEDFSTALKSAARGIGSGDFTTRTFNLYEVAA
jgi:heme-degrading monooxygenase HmoA